VELNIQCMTLCDAISLQSVKPIWQ